ncbi:MAG TPA: undecaprenyldiphospho-muramoylpentapeptide beta-N-acetylglucosaminyltransferase [Pseudomonadota bacterium]|nr:undecaprenyldiphospho-muramoylpentapeptide beta-N-acetylglucosaminyltransferase [Pseudomonadota bacterium]
MTPSTPERPLRILIAGGGTGGHLFPGLALAHELTAQGAHVTFVGTDRGIEKKAVPQAGYPLELIDIAGLSRQGFWLTLKNVAKLPLAFVQTLCLLRRLSPDAVVGVGGYASGPVVLLAALFRIPTVILEQNSIPGVTNRILSRFAKKVFTAFPRAASFFPAHKVACIGNPIRASIVEAAKSKTFSDHKPLHLLVLGGSLGAKAVNALLVSALAELPRLYPALAPLSDHLRVLHQTGQTDCSATLARYAEHPELAPLVQVEPFLEDMAAAYLQADLVVGRAGATTLAELAVLGLPALLVPFPYAADDHQTHNAQHFADKGAALLLPQDRTTPKQLADHLAALLANPKQRQTMSQAAKTLATPTAPKDLTHFITQSLTKRHQPNQSPTR